MQTFVRIFLSLAIVLGTLTIAPITVEAQQRSRQSATATASHRSGSQGNRSSATASSRNNSNRSSASQGNRTSQRSKAQQSSRGTSQRSKAQQSSRSTSQRSKAQQSSRTSTRGNDRTSARQADNRRRTQSRAQEAEEVTTNETQQQEQVTETTTSTSRSKARQADNSSRNRQKASSSKNGKQSSKAASKAKSSKQSKASAKATQRPQSKADNNRKSVRTDNKSKSAKTDGSRTDKKTSKKDSKKEAKKEAQEQKRAEKEIERAEKKEARDNKREQLTRKNSKVDVIGEGPAYNEGIEKEKPEWTPTHILGFGPRGGMSSFLPKTERWPASRPANLGYNASFDIDYTFAMINKKGYGFGIRTGVSAGYTSNGQNVYLVEHTPYTDLYGNLIEYTITAKSVNEVNSQLIIEVPVQFNIRVHGFYADLGVRLQVPMIPSFTQKIENVNIDAYYPQYDVHVANDMSTGLLAEAEFNKKGTWDSSKFGVLVAGEIGYYIPLSTHLMLGLGLYGGYSVYNLQSAFTPTNRLFTINQVGESPTSANITATTLNKAYTQSQGYFDLGAKLTLNVKF